MNILEKLFRPSGCRHGHYSEEELPRKGYSFYVTMKRQDCADGCKAHTKDVYQPTIRTCLGCGYEWLVDGYGEDVPKEYKP